MLYRSVLAHFSQCTTSTTVAQSYPEHARTVPTNQYSCYRDCLAGQYTFARVTTIRRDVVEAKEICKDREVWRKLSYERMNLADALVPRTYNDGDLIIKQGVAADGMYFVEDGVVQVTILGDDGQEVEVC
ncbi:unnamed protein product [Timema podura]|uniref:Cyclic nucleotide-binding domain-containing protein n=1 Tax=Timema podura TaxID=61482 RepID=A0ABN7PDU7_TIMPD|nr:unnamed protein product [Timema podura]